MESHQYIYRILLRFINHKINGNTVVFNSFGNPVGIGGRNGVIVSVAGETQEK
jgi:hypothetical protein